MCVFKFIQSHGGRKINNITSLGFKVNYMKSSKEPFCSGMALQFSEGCKYFPIYFWWGHGMYFALLVQHNNGTSTMFLHLSYINKMKYIPNSFLYYNAYWKLNYSESYLWIVLPVSQDQFDRFSFSPLLAAAVVFTRTHSNCPICYRRRKLITILKIHQFIRHLSLVTQQLLCNMPHHLHSLVILPWNTQVMDLGKYIEFQ